MCYCLFSCVQLHFSQKDEELQKQINELRTNLALIKQSLKTKEKAVADDREKMKNIGRKLTSIGSGGSALEGIQKDLMSAVSSFVLKIYHMQCSIAPSAT